MTDIGTFDEAGNAIVGNIAIPASHVEAFRALGRLDMLSAMHVHRILRGDGNA